MQQLKKFKLSNSFNISGASQLRFITTEITTSDGMPPTDIKSGADSKMTDVFINGSALTVLKIAAHHGST